MKLVWDSEGDGFLESVTKLHCLAAFDLDSGTLYEPKSITDAIDLIDGADCSIGHNIIGYDYPALKKCYDYTPRKDQRIIDTLVLAKMLWPEERLRPYDIKIAHKFPNKSLIGSRSLEAFGYRVGKSYKGDFQGPWDRWTPEMQNYMVQDVMVNVDLFHWLMQDPPPDKAIDLEMRVAQIIQRQHEHGFYFDLDKAMELLDELMSKKEEIEDRVHKQVKPYWRPKENNLTTPKKTMKKFVQTEHGQLHLRKDPKTKQKKPVRGVYEEVMENCPYQKIELHTFDPGNNRDIAHILLCAGWQPKELTEKQTARLGPYWREQPMPKIDPDNIGTFNDPIVQDIVDYLVVKKRLSTLQGGGDAYLKALGSDQRIHGHVDSLGAVTVRMTHNKPNTANITSTRKPYGKEFRSLFCVPKGKILIGCDADGAQLRGLAHYLYRYDGGRLTERLEKGDKTKGTDAHSLNAAKCQELTGLDINRDNCKTFVYSIMFDATDKRLGSEVNQGPKIGKLVRKAIFSEVVGFDKFVNKAKEKFKEQGFVRGLDGRKLFVREQRKVVMTLIQSYEAIVMKMFLVILDDMLQHIGLVPGHSYEFVSNVHDEVQIEALPDHEDLISDCCYSAMLKAGQNLGTKCPMRAEVKVGETWLDTH